LLQEVTKISKNTKKTKFLASLKTAVFTQKQQVSTRGVSVKTLNFGQKTAFFGLPPKTPKKGLKKAFFGVSLSIW
jgi:hypothetical protein